MKILDALAGIVIVILCVVIGLAVLAIALPLLILWIAFAIVGILFESIWISVRGE